MRSAVVVVCAAGCVVLGSGCEPSGGSGSAGSSQNSGKSQPQSLLGRSVQTAKDLRTDIEGRDLATGAMAGITSGDGVVDAGSIIIPIPSDWTQEEPSNSMRLAQFAAGDGEVLITVSRAGGTVDDNLDRWSMQVLDGGEPVYPEMDTFTAAGKEVTVAEYVGDYTTGGGMMGGQQTTYSGYSLVGAVIDTGPTKVFVKMTGPTSLVDDERATFDNVLHGIQEK